MLFYLSFFEIFSLSFPQTYPLEKTPSDILSTCKVRLAGLVQHGDQRCLPLAGLLQVPGEAGDQVLVGPPRHVRRSPAPHSPHSCSRTGEGGARPRRAPLLARLLTGGEGGGGDHLLCVILTVAPTLSW